MAKEKAAKAQVRMPVLVGGLVALLAGLALLGYGLAPATKLGAIGGAFSGGPPDPNLSATIEGAIEGLKARVLFDILGFVGVLGGIVALKSATKKPKPKTLEEQVAEEVARRLGETNGKVTGGMAAAVLAGSVQREPTFAQPVAGPVVSPPPAVPVLSAVPPVATSSSTPVPPLVAAPSPVPAASPLAELAGVPGHCARCGRTLLGGRFCRVCDR
ncbi:MAG: hypothetical protein AABX89_03185 [Candidatus Thermoplasmatota archaeon]